MPHECDPESTAPCSGGGALVCDECVDEHMDACVPRLWHERMDPYGLDPDGWMRFEAMHPMKPFARALETIARVMRDGAATHPDNDWIERPPAYHVAHAEEHLRLLREGEQLEDHLAHAATRLLMALTLREIS